MVDPARGDCWPVTSWSAVDGAGRRKPMWHGPRRAYADRLLTLAARGGRADVETSVSGTLSLSARVPSSAT
ncbi:hypothetical protein AB0J74_15610 [Asanoa sp. NPDC049573]|uniref:hypothetical protein n=1 Tax=Asanoa sp. NPDC049573 TaxID=3155396 RepID=UPI003442352C